MGMQCPPDQDWLPGARRVMSPNCDERPPGCAIELVVVHGISLPPGEYGGPGIDRLFTNSLDTAAHPYFATLGELKVSSHLLIRRDGETVQYVPFSKRAWHAGESCYNNRVACNDFSIGIELEGQDDEPYDDRQYATLSRVFHVLLALFPSLTTGAITGHADIAPGRKTDPGAAFDWPRLRKLISQQGHGNEPG